MYIQLITNSYECAWIKIEIQVTLRDRAVTFFVHFSLNKFIYISQRVAAFFFLWQCSFCFFPSQHRHRNCRCQRHICNKRRSKNVSGFGLISLQIWAWGGSGACLWIPLSPVFINLFWKDAELWHISGAPGHLYQSVCLLIVQRFLSWKMLSLGIKTEVGAASWYSQE